MSSNDDFPVIRAELNRHVVLAKCEYFVDVQLWPIHSVMNPSHWLENFLESELEHAVYLLNSFLYYSEPLVNEMFKAAFQSLSRYAWHRGDTFLSAQAAWRSFVDRVVITNVTGEVPNITDSGFVFARKARQLLEIDEARILSPEKTIQELLSRGPRPIVFVDDFVGSGNQFVETWHRNYEASSSLSISFDRLSSSIRGAQFFYCPLLCTEKGAQTIQDYCPQVILNPAHVLSHRYNALADDSLIWPPHLRSTAVEFVRQASARAAIPDTNGIDVNDWQGFHKLGLAIAFAHSVPDATMPIFYWEQNGWKPLIRRT